MIQANELRLGNYISFKDKQYKASMLGDLSVAIAVNGSKDHEFIKCEELGPIPLTPEWLERCGFTSVKNGVSLELNEQYQQICFLFKGPLSLEVDSCRMPLYSVKYLHHLQNLFFALTGTEITIKL